MKARFAQYRQRLLVWVWDKLNSFPINTPASTWYMEDRAKLSNFLKTDAGQRFEAHLLCRINHEARQATWAGKEWNCGFAQGVQVMLTQILELAANPPKELPPKDSANVPQSKDESKPDATRLPRRLSSKWS